jgi:hypothetical protein
MASGPAEVKRRFGGKYFLNLAWPLIDFEDTGEVSPKRLLTALPYIPGDKTLHGFRCMNFTTCRSTA